MSFDLWRISFDEPRFADEGVHHFSFGSARKVSGTLIRWCEEHDGGFRDTQHLDSVCSAAAYAIDAGFDPPACRIVWRILINPKGET